MQTPTAIPDDSFVYLPGTIPVVVTAPHARALQKPDRLKPGEPETEVWARHLNATAGAHAFIKVRDDGNDPNDAVTSPFRDAVAELAARENLVAGLDLHQLSPTREQDFIIGTGKGRNVGHNPQPVALLRAAFAAAGDFDILVDEIFPALGEHRVSSDVFRRTGVPYMQVEVNSTLAGDLRVPVALEALVRELAALPAPVSGSYPTEDKK